MVEAVRKKKAVDKEWAKSSLEGCAAVFDLEKLLITPISNNSHCFYRGTYHSHNFTVYDMAEMEGFNYFWEEVHGGKGCSEITSCLERFMVFQVTNNNIKEFRFYSDNCWAQNKNIV